MQAQMNSDEKKETPPAGTKDDDEEDDEWKTVKRTRLTSRKQIVRRSPKFSTLTAKKKLSKIPESPIEKIQETPAVKIKPAVKLEFSPGINSGEVHEDDEADETRS